MDIVVSTIGVISIIIAFYCLDVCKATKSNSSESDAVTCDSSANNEVTCDSSVYKAVTRMTIKKPLQSRDYKGKCTNSVRN